MADITSANAVIMLWAPLVYPTPVQIQGFAAEDIFQTQPVAPNETMMGLDGGLSAGFVPTEKKWEITLMADSPSISWFDGMNNAAYAAYQALSIFGSVTLTSIGKLYQMNRGFLTRYPPMPDGRKILQPQKFEITFQNIFATPVGLAG
jgi:tail fiber protein gp32